MLTLPFPFPFPSDANDDHLSNSVTKKAVCGNKSTLYNIPAIKEYLGHRRIDSYLNTWSFQIELRRKLWRLANPTECHTKDMITYNAYQNCAIRRNQRMEFYLPHYPKHYMK